MTWPQKAEPLQGVLAGLLDAVHDPAVVVDVASGCVAWCNRAAERVYGRPSSALAGVRAADLRAGPDRDAFLRRCERWLCGSVEGGALASATFEESLLGAAQTPVLATTRCVLVRSADATLLVAISRPMAASGSADDASPLLRILEQLPIGMVIAEPGSPDAVHLNAECAALFRLSSPGRHGLEELSRSWRVRTPRGVELRADDLPTLRALLRGERSGGVELELVPTDGSAPRTVSTSSAPVCGSDGRVLAAVTAVVDVSEHCRTERELVAARESAEREARAKAALYASLSRELRNPLTSILGYIDLVAEQEPQQGERAEWLRIVRRNGEMLLGLIHDLVDLSRLEAGTLALERAPFSTGLVVGEVLSQVRARAQRQGLDLMVRYSTPVPRRLHGDAARLRQLISTMLSFGLEHAARGDVTLQVAVIGTASGRRLAFDVTALCPGVSAADLEGLFGSPAGVSSSARAAGLGVTLARRLAQMMGGSIEGRLDGERLGLRLTIAPEAADLDDVIHMNLLDAEEAPISSQPPSHFAGRVLVVEDQEDDRRLVEKMLQRLGLTVVCARSGAEALDLAADRFDVVLMDVEMPEPDGLEVTRRLRAAGVAVPIVALTAAALAGDRERCLQAGCTAYVPKPIDRPVLVRALAGLISSSESRSSLASLPLELASFEPLHSSREDDPVVRELLPQFVGRLARYLEAVRKAVAAGDGDAAATSAHSLKGTATNYGFEALGAAAERLEQLCRRDARAAAGDEARAALQAILDVANRIRAAYPSRMSLFPNTRPS
jgi:CheY-like chemotaxis protein/HPt (histidine-containing phosphotransfer) domain-containing protein